MMGRRQRLRGGSEYDVLYARSMYCYLKRSRVKKGIKRQMNRRMRRELKLESWQNRGV